MADSHRIDTGYLVAGVFIAAIGWIIGVGTFGKGGSFNPDPAGEVSVFALVYVLAQGVERVVEGTLAFVTGAARLRNKEFATTTKANAVTEKDNSKAESAETNIRAFSFGLALGVAFVGCGYFGIRMLELIGVEDVDNDRVELFVTGLVVAGGSKPLHDLISKIQKSKQKDEKEPAAS